MRYTRFAIYYVPPRGAAWAAACAEWLGRDMETDAPLTQPRFEGLDLPRLTEAPRRYGLHATLKPPFRLAGGAQAGDLEDAVALLARRLAPVRVKGLRIDRLGRFLALRPDGDNSTLVALAAACVEAPDRFRAPPSGTELARRRAARLTPSQEANLRRWGYPYVMDDFRFHVTLTGRAEPETLTRAEQALKSRIGPLLPRPFEIDEIALAGETDDGPFRLIRRFALAG